MPPQSFKDDTESTSASTLSTMNGRNFHHQQQGHRSYSEQPTQKYKKKQKHKRTKSFLQPVSTVRQISWDNCSISVDRDNSSEIEVNHEKSDRRGRSISSSRIRKRLSGNFPNTLRGSGISMSGSTNPQESLNGRHNEEDKKSSRAVTIGRELFIVFILITAAVFGSMSY